MIVTVVGSRTKTEHGKTGELLTGEEKSAIVNLRNTKKTNNTDNVKGL